MSASVPLQRTFSITGDASQLLDFAVDAGAYRCVAARLYVHKFSGSSSTATVRIQRAALNDEPEFQTLITFSGVSDGASMPVIEIMTSEDFARFLRWDVSFSAGATDFVFSIQLVLKS